MGVKHGPIPAWLVLAIALGLLAAGFAIVFHVTHGYADLLGRTPAGEAIA